MKRVNKMLLAEIAIITALTVLSQTGLTRLQVPPPVVQVVVIGKSAPAAKATIYSADYCLPCRKYIGGTKQHSDGIRDHMPKDGWVIKDAKDKDAASANILISKNDHAAFQSLGIKSLPCTIIRKNGKEHKRIYGRVDSDSLANEINEVAKLKE